MVKKIKNTKTARSNLEIDELSFARQLITLKYLYKIGASGLDFDKNHNLYRLSVDEHPYTLNFWRSSMVPKNVYPVELSATLYSLAYDCIASLKSHKAKDFDSLRSSALYKKFQRLSLQLQKVDMEELNAQQKKPFLINIHNTLSMHARIHLGNVSEMLFSEGRNLFSYKIGQYVYTLNEILDGLLRGSSEMTLSTLKNEPKFEYKLGEVDPRIHFVLISSFFNRTDHQLDMSNVEEKIKEQTSTTLQSLLFSGDTVFLPTFFEEYAGDFGFTKEAICKYILNHVEESSPLYKLLEQPERVHFEFSNQARYTNSLQRIPSLSLIGKIGAMMSPRSKKLFTERSSKSESQECLSPIKENSPPTSPERKPSLHSLLRGRTNSSPKPNQTKQETVTKKSMSSGASPKGSIEDSDDLLGPESNSDSVEEEILSVDNTKQNFSPRRKVLVKAAAVYIPRSRPSASSKKFSSLPQTEFVLAKSKALIPSSAKSLSSEDILDLRIRTLSPSPSRSASHSFNSSDESDLSRLSSSDIVKVLQTKKDRNNIMEDKCKQLSSETDAIRKKTAACIFSLIEIKKKISSAIDLVRSRMSQLDQFGETAHTSFYKTNFLEKLAKDLEESRSHSVNVVPLFSNESVQHSYYVEVVNQRTLPVVVAQESEEATKHAGKVEDDLLLVSTHKMLCNQFEEHLKSQFREFDLAFYQEISLLSKKLIGGNTLREKLKQMESLHLSEASMARVILSSDSAKTWDLVSKKIEAAKIDKKDAQLTEFLNLAKKDILSVLQPHLQEFLSKQLPPTRDPAESFSASLAQMLSAERDHLFDLTQFEHFFRQASLEKSKKGAKWISIELTNLLSDHCAEFMSFHKKLLSACQSLQLKPVFQQNVSQIFLDMEADFDIFVEYAKMHAYRVNCFFDVLDHKRYKAFFEQLEMDQLSGTKIINILLSPSQMLDRYRIFLYRAVSNVPESMLEDLKKAQAMILKIQDKFNTALRKGERSKQLQEINELFNETGTIPTVDFAKEGREFILACPVIVKESLNTAKSNEEEFLFLFTDILLVVSKKKNRTLLKQAIFLEHLFLSHNPWRMSVSGQNKSSSYVGVEVRSPLLSLQTLFFCFESEKEAESWLSVFCNTQKQWMKALNSKTSAPLLSQTRTKETDDKF